MIRDLDKRLRKLESRLPPERSEEEEFKSEFQSLLMYAVGYYFGDPKPGEPPVTALARALGYEHCELLDALNKKASGRNDPEFDEKYIRANRKLFAKFGVHPKTSSGREFSEALKRIYAGLSESYKKRLAYCP